jgi:hypothetical protein
MESKPSTPRPLEDSWNLPAVSEEDEATQRVTEADRLAGDVEIAKQVRLPNYPYPASTPERLLSKPRDKMTGCLLDVEPPVPGEDWYARDEREKRNLKAVKDDREEFHKPKDMRYPAIFNQRWSQLVVDLRWPRQPHEQFFTVYVDGGPEHPWLKIPGAHQAEVEKRYLEACGIREKIGTKPCKPILVIEPFRSA